MSTESWLSTALPSHSIFTLPSAPAQAFGVASSSTAANPTGGLGKHAKRSTMVVRGGDLIVAVDHEIRMCSLGEVKSGGRGSFKTLRTPNLNFEITSLVPSPTGKLLAVLGSRQVVVIVLPRPGYINLVTPTVECRSIPIGSYHHSPSSSPLTKALWHPLSSTLSSLLLLTLDGQLREYDPLKDAEEPQQVVSLLPPMLNKKSGRNSGYWAAEEPGSREAVSFALGRGEGDWGSISIYGLMENGDIYGICPFLPSVARLPRSLIYSLSTVTAQKLSFLHSPSLSSSTSSITTVLPDPILLARYHAQKQWIDQLIRQIPSADIEDASDEETSGEPVEVKLEDMKGSLKRTAVQGPFLFDPPPKEIDDEEGEEDLTGSATDLFMVGLGEDGTAEEEIGKKGEVLGVLGIVWKDGRVDVCLEVEKMEGVWSGGKTVISESNPTLSVYESITLLPSPRSLPSSLRTALRATSPSFFVDPLYEDTVYVHHALGVHCIVMKSWMGPLGRALGLEDEDKREVELGRVVGRGVGSLVGCVVDSVSEDGQTSAPIQSVAIISDVYLSYSLLTLTSSLQLVALELALRVATPSSPALVPLALGAPTPSSSSPPSPSSHYTSYLRTDPFVVPTILEDRSSLPLKARIALPPPPSGQTKTLESITPDNLRYLGKTIQSFRSSTREILSAGSAVQARLDLQLKELERQMDKVMKIEDLTASMRFGSKHGSKEGLQARVERVRNVQKELISRVDKTLQGLMDRHQPMLSDMEKAWFAELRQLNEEVGGKTLGEEEGGLRSRVATIENHLNVLRPQLEEMRARALEHKEMKQKQNAALGRHQLARLEDELATESKLISSVTSKLDRLSVQTNAVTL
ncbi:Nucleoporin Nup88 [Phaffia rhodozyma]|uniref:Nucleoporin Nup88 n=1 Tax=Phaffia rhodozyma TaxID=264483 RepID=A0A0F7SL60_PHARH|nr:Nucleoporin Nup88 [Phaffia rhodozyma]